MKGKTIENQPNTIECNSNCIYTTNTAHTFIDYLDIELLYKPSSTE